MPVDVVDFVIGAAGEVSGERGGAGGRDSTCGGEDPGSNHLDGSVVDYGGIGLPVPDEVVDRTGDLEGGTTIDCHLDGCILGGGAAKVDSLSGGHRVRCGALGESNVGCDDNCAVLVSCESCCELLEGCFLGTIGGLFDVEDTCGVFCRDVADGEIVVLAGGVRGGHDHCERADDHRDDGDRGQQFGLPSFLIHYSIHRNT